MHISDSVARGQACDLGSVTWPMQGRLGSGPREAMAAWEGTSLLLGLMVEMRGGGDSGRVPGLQS